MALQDTRPGKPAHNVIGIEIYFWDTRLDILEGDRIVLIDQVSYQESHLVVSEQGRGNKNIVVAYGDIAASQLLASQHTRCGGVARRAMFNDESVGRALRNDIEHPRVTWRVPEMCIPGSSADPQPLRAQGPDEGTVDRRRCEPGPNQP